MKDLEISFSTKLIFNDWLSFLKDSNLESNILFVTSNFFNQKGFIEKFKSVINSFCIHVLKDVSPNPDISEIKNYINYFKDEKINLIVALGGGSVIDTAKIISLFISKDCNFSIDDFFEKKIQINHIKTIPIIAIPTTAGTGSEVTQFATVWDMVGKKKYSISSEFIRPKIALYDGDFIKYLPDRTLKSAGLDTISHGFESIWNKNASKKSIEIATKSLKISLKILPQLLKDKNSKYLRLEMLKSSCLAGIAISSTKTALAHSISYPFTTNFNLAHGVACSFTLPSLLNFNSQEDDGRLKKLAEDLEFPNVYELSVYLKNLLISFGIPELLKFHLPEDINEILFLSNAMNNPERSKNNIRKVNIKDIEQILYESLTNLNFIID